MPALIKNVHIGLTQQSCKLEFGGSLGKADKQITKILPSDFGGEI